MGMNSAYLTLGNPLFDLEDVLRVMMVGIHDCTRKHFPFGIREGFTCEIMFILTQVVRTFISQLSWFHKSAQFEYSSMGTCSLQSTAYQN